MCSDNYCLFTSSYCITMLEPNTQKIFFHHAFFIRTRNIIYLITFIQSYRNNLTALFYPLLFLCYAFLKCCDLITPAYKYNFERPVLYLTFYLTAFQRGILPPSPQHTKHIIRLSTILYGFGLNWPKMYRKVLYIQYYTAIFKYLLWTSHCSSALQLHEKKAEHKHWKHLSWPCSKAP